MPHTTYRVLQTTLQRTRYIDLHGHATKRGCFLYGNALADLESQTENVLYARLCALNSRFFDFSGSVFTQRNMYRKDKRDGLSKQGAGRVRTLSIRYS